VLELPTREEERDMHGNVMLQLQAALAHHAA
jgi:hypothetical protein